MTSAAAPRVSVLLSVHNGARYLRESIESVLEQSFGAYEFWIIDDGSTDASADIVEEYAKRDARIRCRHQTNRGLTVTLAQSVPLCRAPLIARQDADDVSAPERLALQVAWFEAHPGAAFCGTNARLLGEDGRIFETTCLPTGHRALARALCIRNSVFHSSAVFSRAAYEHAGGYRPFFRYAQDYDLWCRMSRLAPIGNLSEPLLVRRFHPGAITVSRLAEQQRYAAIASTLHYAASAYKTGIEPGPALDALDFVPDPELNRLLRMHFEIFLTCHTLGAADQEIQAGRWKLLRQSLRVRDAGMALRFWLYAILGPQGFRRFRSATLFRRLFSRVEW